LILNCAHSKEELLQLQKELQEEFSIKCLVSIGDVSSPDFVTQMFWEAKKQLGGVDILINNAGISHIGLLSEMSNEEWERVMAVNLNSVFYCCREAIPHMLRKKSGKIINVSSVWGTVGASMEVAYSASKGGIHAFTKALAKELAPSNIQVNALAFGVMDTRMNDCFSPEERQALEEEIPMGRFGMVQEAGEAIYQLSIAPAYLTGQVISVDGGWC
jgi:3-oxoacyl-[acyl-carrier protein] reductase